MNANGKTSVMANTLKLALAILSFITVTAMTSCSSSADDDMQAASETSKVVEGSKLILGMSTSTSGSRADASTDGEANISGLRVFFCDNSDNIKYVVTSYDNTANPSSVVIALDEQNIPVGTYHIFIGANLSDALKSQLKVGANISSAVASITSVSSLTESGKFVMFGEAVSGTSSEITLAEGQTSSASVSLTRVVAKMIVTATVDSNNCISDPNGIADIKLTDMQYTLVNTNTKFYCMQKTVNGTVEDPNHSMDSFLNSTSEFMNPEDSKSVQAYDANKITSNDATYTANASYCLENTSDESASFSSWSASVQTANAQKVATYVRITVKATPKLIDGKAFATVTLTNGKYYTNLQASGSAKYLCFSSAATLRAYFGTVADSNIQEHSTADTYSYNVFVDSKTFTAAGSSVLRNHYYVLNINSMSTPFITKVMEINTKVANWNVKGTTVQTIDTSNAN